VSKNHGTTLTEIAAACRDLSDLLQSVGAVGWAETIESIQAMDLTSVEAAHAALGYFGGMGSITDWVISELNGHNLGNRSHDKLNDDLKQRTTCLYDALTGAVNLNAVRR
jgi:hypothetical protein